MKCHYTVTHTWAESELCCRWQGSSSRIAASGGSQNCFASFLFSLNSCCDWRYPTSSSITWGWWPSNSHDDCVLLDIVAQNGWLYNSFDWLLACLMPLHKLLPAVSKFDFFSVTKCHPSVHRAVCFRAVSVSVWQSTRAAADGVPDFLCLI